MPSTNTTYQYMQVTNKNLKTKDAIFDATVVANYGDPGLTEDYHADILSRYVICAIESSNRVLTNGKYKNILVVVRRPQSLWISYQGGFINNPVSQIRIDSSSLNSNVGAAGNYSVNSIGQINTPYTLGQRIKIKLLKNPDSLYLTKSNTFFQSACSLWGGAYSSYQGTQNQGLNNSYTNYISNSNGQANLQLKTIAPFYSSNSALSQINSNNNFYWINVNKIQYEAFLLYIYGTSNSTAQSYVSLFNGSGPSSYYSNNGGYAYQNNFNLNLNYCSYEDANSNLSRIATSSCIPLIVATPNTFTVPQTRNSGTVNYTPTYQTITKS
jgi:hypothetical protein